jgi:hypothetical protein
MADSRPCSSRPAMCACVRCSVGGCGAGAKARGGGSTRNRHRRHTCVWWQRACHDSAAQRRQLPVAGPGGAVRSQRHEPARAQPRQRRLGCVSKLGEWQLVERQRAPAHVGGSSGREHAAAREGARVCACASTAARGKPGAHQHEALAHARATRTHVSSCSTVLPDVTRPVATPSSSRCCISG